MFFFQSVQLHQRATVCSSVMDSGLTTSSATSLRIWECISSGQLPHLSFLDYPVQIFYSCQSQHMSITQSIPTSFCGSNQAIVPIWAVGTSSFCLFPTGRIDNCTGREALHLGCHNPLLEEFALIPLRQPTGLVTNSFPPLTQG